MWTGLSALRTRPRKPERAGWTDLKFVLKISKNYPMRGNRTRNEAGAREETSLEGNKELKKSSDQNHQQPREMREAVQANISY